MITDTGLSKEAYIRSVLPGNIPREKPDERFYTVMKDLIDIANNANQIAKQVNNYDSDVACKLHNEAEKLARFQLDARRAFLLPEKIRWL
jgi:hypothetical protein